MPTQRSVVVTGVSTGIGWGVLKVLVAKGFSVYGTVRKEVDADRLRKEFGQSFVPLLLDVTDRDAVERAAAQVSQELGSSRLAGLVNNAGIAVPGPLRYLSLDDFRRQLEVNLVAPLSVTQAFVPLLGADPNREGTAGRIVNISSVAGKLALPFLGAYAASKFALEGLSEALRRELMVHGIDVIVIGPGSVNTPIWDKGEAQDLSRYKNTEYAAVLERFRNFMVQQGRKGLTSEHLGEVVHRALTTRKPRTRYAVVPQRFRNWTLPSLLPHRVLDRLIAKQLGLV
jgi:hypothetical protein